MAPCDGKVCFENLFEKKFEAECFIAPELIEPDEEEDEVDPNSCASDVYALGCVFYEVNFDVGLSTFD